MGAWSVFLETLISTCQDDYAAALCFCLCSMEFLFWFFPSLLLELFEPYLEKYLLEPEKPSNQELRITAWVEALLQIFVFHPVLIYCLLKYFSLYEYVDFSTTLPQFWEFVTVFFPIHPYLRYFVLLGTSCTS